MVSFEIEVIDDDVEETIKFAGDKVILYVNEDSLNEMFELLDEGLHDKKTYDYFEDRCYGLEEELEEKESIIEMYRERAEERGRI
jgi:hypothetical protein